MFDYYNSLLSQHKEGNLFEPLVVNLLITNRCNLKCKHCFNWEANNNDKKRDLTYEEYVKISNSMGKIPFLIVSGGEPFLRSDLSDIVRLFVKGNTVTSMGFATNGFDTHRTINQLEKILNENSDTMISLSFSIDGPERIHNLIRNNENAFSNVVTTWLMANELKKKYRNLSLGIACVVNNYNQDHLDELYELLVNEMKADDIHALLIRQSPSDAETKKDIDMDKYENFTKKIKLLILKKNYQSRFSALTRASKLLAYQVISRIVKTNTRQLDCIAGIGSIVIDNEGGVYACECRRPVANLRNSEYDFKRIFYSEEFSKERSSIKEKGCFCTHETQGLVPSLMFSEEHANKLEEISNLLYVPAN